MASRAGRNPRGFSSEAIKLTSRLLRCATRARRSASSIISSQTGAENTLWSMRIVGRDKVSPEADLMIGWAKPKATIATMSSRKRSSQSGVPEGVSSSERIPSKIRSGGNIWSRGVGGLMRNIHQTIGRVSKPSSTRGARNVTPAKLMSHHSRLDKVHLEQGLRAHLCGAE